MKPAAFEYFRPGSLDEALALLAEHGGDAKPLAGGQSLIPAMNFRLATPAVLVDLNGISELSYIKNDAADVRIGGMTRQRMVERSGIVSDQVPLIAETMPHIAHPAIRNRGTIGGSLAHADPAAELPAVMVAVNAHLTVSSRAGAREVEADEFFVGLFSTAVQPGELLTEIRISPPASRSGFAFQEISRRHGDFALVGVAAVVSLDTGGNCADARIALLSVGDRPMRAVEAAKILAGQRPSPNAIAAAADAAATKDIDPSSDIHASARYRRHLAKVLTRRVLTRAFERANVTLA
ncbi:MAG TPA: xanthine dehydrogenase family protein subunit M [Vicinamibacterales bacterium]|nr:xanthine dehydrogenase family protein subunit M [Vicinamibacterales bacterium]